MGAYESRNQDNDERTAANRKHNEMIDRPAPPQNQVYLSNNNREAEEDHQAPSTLREIITRPPNNAQGGQNPQQRRQFELDVPLVINNQKMFTNGGELDGCWNKTFTLKRLPAEKHILSLFKLIFLIIGLFVFFFLGLQFTNGFLYGIVFLSPYLIGVWQLCTQVSYQHKGSTNYEDVYKHSSNPQIQLVKEKCVYTRTYIGNVQDGFRSETALVVDSTQSRFVSIVSQTDKSPRIPSSLLSKDKYLRFKTNISFYFQDQETERRYYSECQQIQCSGVADHIRSFIRIFDEGVAQDLLVSDLKSTSWLKCLHVFFIIIGLDYLYLTIVECFTQRYNLQIIRQVRI